MMFPNASRFSGSLVGRALIPLLTVLGLLAACQPEAAPASEGESPSPAGSGWVVPEEGWRLQAEPGPEGRLLRELPAGEVLLDLGESSAFTTPLYLRDSLYDEPWLRVRTAGGEEGWIYGALLHFLPEGGEEELRQARLKALLGPRAATRLGEYREDFAAIGSSQDFARVYRRGLRLRDTLIDGLETAFAGRKGGALPDLFWLRREMPGFVPQLVAENTAYHLFADYRQWLGAARRTPEKTDDRFVGLMLTAFPQDSVEYFFPVWTIQTTDYSGHSLLGRGHHRRLLGRIDDYLRADTLLRAEALRLKSDLVNDITQPHVTYWEAAGKMSEELQAILNDSLPVLDRYDRIALQGRLDQLADPPAHGLVVDRQSGE